MSAATECLKIKGKQEFNFFNYISLVLNAYIYILLEYACTQEKI